MVKEEVMVNLNELKPVESSGIDLKELEGTKSNIEQIIVEKVPSTYSKDGKQLVLKLLTKVVTSFDDKEGNKIEVRASELFNLTKDKETGSIGWSKHPKADLQKFLKKMNVNHPQELIGKTVTIVPRTKETKDKGTLTFLGFIRE